MTDDRCDSRHSRAGEERQLQQVQTGRKREHRQRTWLATDSDDVPSDSDVCTAGWHGHGRCTPDQGDDTAVLRRQVRRLDRRSRRLGECRGLEGG